MHQYTKEIVKEKKKHAREIANTFQYEFSDNMKEVMTLSQTNLEGTDIKGLSEMLRSSLVYQFKYTIDGNKIYLIDKANVKFHDDTILNLISQLLPDSKDSTSPITLFKSDSGNYFTCIKLLHCEDNTRYGVLIIGLCPVEKFLTKLSNLNNNRFFCAVKVNNSIITSLTNGACIDSVIKDNLQGSAKEFGFKCRVEHLNRNFVGYAMDISKNIRLITVSDISIPIRIPLSFFSFSLIVMLLIASVYFIYKSRLQNQIAEINNTVVAISQKDFDHKLSESYGGEVGLLVKSINQMSVQLKEIYDSLELKVISRTSEISMRNAELRTQQREILKQNHELKSAYDALKDSREKYEKLIEQLEEEYIFYSQSVKGELLYVSTSVKKILGFEVKEYRRLSEKLYTDNPINIIARERSENLRNGIAQPKYLKEIFDADHQPKIFEVTEVPVFSEEGQLVSVEGVAQDITERETAEELIKEQEEKYRMLFAYASDFIFLYELDKENKKTGNIIEANNYMIKLLGYSLDELRQKTPADLCLSEFEVDENKNNEEYLANDIKYERIWESGDGNILNVEISSHAFKIRNKHVAIAVARDISERKRAVEEIRFVNEELTNQKENLEALVDNLTQTQEQLVQSEKMAALGQLIAGIAHEINTPLGAIKASIGNLSDSLENAMVELPSLLRQQSLENLQLFSLIFELARKKAPELSSREKRQIKKDLTNKLKESGIDQPDVMADLFIFLDIYELKDNLIEQIIRPDSIKIIRSARNFISLMKNTTTINIAVEKATKVVFALKKYAHRDSGGEKVPTDIIDGIETVLTLYHNQLKQGIEVIRDYDKLPLVACYQDEISQVWTNLVQNAIQAMSLEGTLTITARYLENAIVIGFKDTGTGIEPDIIDKIFEPFFTTKKQGEGSGLGLDIVKKIIEKHEGSITVESILGKGAHFIIKIPVS
jgi:two-component system, NtrC family, sensor kinase